MNKCRGQKKRLASSFESESDVEDLLTKLKYYLRSSIKNMLLFSKVTLTGHCWMTNPDNIENELATVHIKVDCE